MASDSPAVRQAKRLERTRKAVEGCDPDIIMDAGKMTDTELIMETWGYSGLKYNEFAEDVLCMEPWHVDDIRYQGYKMHRMLRRFLLIQVIRMRQRQRSGTLPETVWCGTCGRGDGVSRVKYVTPPNAETLFLLEGMDDREG